MSISKARRLLKTRNLRSRLLSASGGACQSIFPNRLSAGTARSRRPGRRRDRALTFPVFTTPSPVVVWVLHVIFENLVNTVGGTCSKPDSEANQASRRLIDIGRSLRSRLLSARGRGWGVLKIGLGDGCTTRYFRFVLEKHLVALWH